MVAVALCDPLRVTLTPLRGFPPASVTCPDMVNELPVAALAVKFCVWLPLRLLNVWLAGLNESPLRIETVARRRGRDEVVTTVRLGETVPVVTG